MGTKGCRLTLGIPNDSVRKMYNETFASNNSNVVMITIVILMNLVIL